MAERMPSYSPTTRAALMLLGAQVAAARRERGWTAAQLAERVGVGPGTIGRLERGEPGVALGTAFEAASLSGVSLFTEDQQSLPALAAAAQHRLALLPARVRKRVVDIDDAF